MPDIESQLRALADEMDARAIEARARRPLERDHIADLVDSDRIRQKRRPVAFAALAVAVVIGLIATFIGIANTRQTRPAPSATSAPSTTGSSTSSSAGTTAPPKPVESTTTTRPPVPGASPQDAAGKQWIVQHGGNALGVGAVVGMAMSSHAIYALIGQQVASEIVELVRVERSTGLVTASRAMSASAAGLSANSDALYLSSAPAGSGSFMLQRLDPLTLDPIWSVPVGEGTIAATDSAIWIGGDGQVERRDPRTGAVQATITFPQGPGPAAVAVGADGQSLWVAYGSLTLELRNAVTGVLIRRVAEQQTAITTGDLAPTVTGVWIATRGGMNGTASFYTLPDLAKAGTLPDGYGGGVEVVPLGNAVLLLSDGLFACADARTGQYLAPPTTGAFPTFGPSAADSAGVVVAVGGRLGVFTPHDLCPGAFP